MVAVGRCEEIGSRGRSLGLLGMGKHEKGRGKF